MKTVFWEPEALETQRPGDLEHRGLDAKRPDIRLAPTRLEWRILRNDHRHEDEKNCHMLEPGELAECLN